MKTPAFFERSELTRVLWGLRHEFAVAVIFTIVVNVLMLTPTLYMLQVFDRVLVSHSSFTLMALTLVMLFFFLVMSFSEWMRSRLLVRTGVKLDSLLNSRVFRTCFERQLRQPGGRPAQSLSDLVNVRQFLTGNGAFAFMDAPWTPIYIMVLFLLHPFLGLVSIVFSIVFVVAAYFSGKVVHQPLEVAATANMELGAFVQNKLKNSEVVESMGMLGGLRRLWQKRHSKALLLNSHAQDATSRMQAMTKFLQYAQQSLALAAGALLVIEGELSPGAMIAANVLMGRATQPLGVLVSSWRSVLSAKDAFLRLENLLEENPVRPRGRAHAPLSGRVEVAQLVAKVPGRESPILKSLSFSVPSGSVVGVVGPSGSGKSTLARCLMGIWPHVEGSVSLDGESIEHWERDELGPYVGYLPQDVELFEGTIAENVARFGEVDSAKVIEACKRAGIHDMILRFPKGYDTPMGVAGGQLSGGQRQRVGLARAIYGNPRFVVLDEPNANLDDVGEAALLAAIRDLKQHGTTVFLITHRTNIIGVTDLLLVLKEGTIALFGSTQEVLARLKAAATPPAPTPVPQIAAVPA
ncbi:MAG: type I secretion system permease/ATPase [Azovibrio sp.]|uniref:type I secretion system permease/ATPase n=1 Tax=Azovibrio sp. TaxID=1872673 RepID=UPI003C78A393